MSSIPPAQPNPPTAVSRKLQWLRKINLVVGQWVAAVSWWRLLALALIALIAGSWIADALRLHHETSPKVHVRLDGKSDKAKDSAENPDAKGECVGERIQIGGKQGIVICIDEPADPEASTESGQATTPKATKLRTKQVTERTLAGWVGDIFSALLVALFAYLVALKVIVKKTAEADAKLRVANAGTEREAMQRQLVQARLKLLQAQVEPHFLFNTLAAVDYLIETNPPKASVMQKALIAYLRAALPQMRQESSTLGREIALIQAYLDLLKLRIEERLEFEISVPDGLRSAIFPPMVLQSLVENAIKHGIEPKPEGGKVLVQAQVVDGALQVQVSDTGVGLPPGDVFGRSQNSTGLGLDNIRNRLAMLYPGRSRMELRAYDHGGTQVLLAVPYQTETASAAGSAAAATSNPSAGI